MFELERSLRSEPGVHLPGHTSDCLQISHTIPVRTNIFEYFVGAGHCAKWFTHILNPDPHNHPELYVHVLLSALFIRWHNWWHIMCPSSNSQFWQSQNCYIALTHSKPHDLSPLLYSSSLYMYLFLFLPISAL